MRVRKPSHRDNCIPSSQRAKNCSRKDEPRTRRTTEKMGKDIWHLVKKQPYVKLILAGPWDPSSFLLLLGHARQVCLIFPSESCSSVLFTRGGSCWERDWETRICQSVVLFPTAVADWPKSYIKTTTTKKSNSGKNPERVKAFGTNGTIGFSCSYRHVFLLIFYLFI